MKIQKGDNVLVIKGKDRGKKGKVMRCLPRDHKVIVEGINVLIRHTRPRRQGEKGQRVEVSAPFDVSNVKLVCPKCGKPTRVVFRITRGKVPEGAAKAKRPATKRRTCQKCKQSI